jgi:HK97 family phage major capsid protein
MSFEDRGLVSLVEQIKQASADISDGDAKTNQRIDELAQSVNELYLKANRPGPGWESKDDNAFDEAIGLCQNRRALTVPKIDADVADNYAPTSAEIDEALVHRKAMKALLRHGNPTRLEGTFQKSLSAFSFGATGFLLAPEMSNQVLRCIIDPTDVSGLVNRVNISAPSIRFPIDNARMLVGGWVAKRRASPTTRNLISPKASECWKSKRKV